MALPIVVLVAELVAAAVNTVASAYAAWIAAGVIDEYKREILAAATSAITLNLGPLATEFANEQIAKTGQSLEFQDVTDADLVKEDLDDYLTERINTKAGTSFTSIQTLTRDEVMSELSDTLADRLFDATGVRLKLWPIDDLKASIQTALVAQLEEGGRGLIDVDMLALVDAAVLRRLGIKGSNGEPLDPELLARRAAAALRQKKWRENNQNHCKC